MAFRASTPLTHAVSSILAAGAVDDSGKVVVRSFRLVFDRGYGRLFKIDRYRLPFAYGLPILGIV
jgi:hypothetical protein